MQTGEISNLLTKSLIPELRRLELRTKRRLDADLMGRYRSAFRGSGLTFSDLREYQPGDEIKNIHWKATARSQRPYVKTYEEDRQLNIMLAVDISNSTSAGSPISKHRRALEFSALIAMLAKNSSDMVGLTLFSDEVEEFYPPRQTRAQFQLLFSSLLKHRKLRKATDISNALQFLQLHHRRASIIFIVSDFLSTDYHRELALLSRKHDVICVALNDEQERFLPKAGLVQVEDAESDRRIIIDTGTKRGQEHYARLFKKRQEKLRDDIIQAGADIIFIEDNPLSPLLKLMNRRTARIC